MALIFTSDKAKYFSQRGLTGIRKAHLSGKSPCQKSLFTDGFSAETGFPANHRAALKKTGSIPKPSRDVVGLSVQ
jgi:hypothetical protein